MSDSVMSWVLLLPNLDQKSKESHSDIVAIMKRSAALEEKVLKLKAEALKLKEEAYFKSLNLEGDLRAKHTAETISKYKAV